MNTLTYACHQCPHLKAGVATLSTPLTTYLSLVPYHLLPTLLW